MRPLILVLAAGIALPAGAATAQTAYGPTGDKMDDMTCRAQALAAQNAADNRASGEIAQKRGLTYDEQEFLRACGGPIPGTPVAVPANQGYYYEEQTYRPSQHRYAPYAAYSSGEVQVVTNGPVPDTPANRARYRPLSHAGRASVPEGN